jgi:hypothetical protein
MLRRGLAPLLCGCLACAAEPDPSGSASATTSTTDPASTSTTQSADESTSSSESTTTVAMTTAPPGDLPPPPEPKSCSLETIDPDADPAVVIDAGDAVGQIPTVVGDALLRNCGCHYNTNMLMVGDGYIDYPDDAQNLATWADFHSDFVGTFPSGFEDMPTYLAVEQRVVFSEPLPMPPFGCGAEDEDAKISAADLALLADWLAAGAPDGASYPGR